MARVTLKSWFRGLAHLPMLAAMSFTSFSALANTPNTIYQEHCASCHGEARLGGMGPALIASNLSRLKKEQARAVIVDGRIATQMPGFVEVLSDREIDEMVDLIYTPVSPLPAWTLEDMLATQSFHRETDDVQTRPEYDADPLNLFVVVESGDHHVSILDGDAFVVLARFPSHYALHGGAKFSPDGRYTYLASRDGWVLKYDLHGLEKVVEIRAGINTRNIATSPDGRYVVVGNYLPHNVVVLDANDLTPVQVIDAISVESKSSRVSAVYSAPPRDSIIVALKDVPEAWEMKARTDAGGPAFDVRRFTLDSILDDFLFDQDYSIVIGAMRGGKGAGVLDLDSGEKRAQLDLEGMPHLGSGTTWDRQGRRVMATPHLSQASISIFDMSDWTSIKTIATGGPGFFTRSHGKSNYLWGDVFFGPNKDQVHIIDKDSLEIVKTLVPEPGKTSGHIEFTRDGRFALVSLLEKDGAIIVYDATTFEEVTRIPMSRPVGKYNVFNKITFSEGTSH